ncbi:MAG: PEP-CTERM sorting domain-containing protein [Pirellulales bacterium]
MSFLSNNELTTDVLRFVIRLDNNTPGNSADDVWFATDAGYIRNSATIGSAANWPTNNELESFAFTTAAAAWRDLTFVAGSTLGLSGTARVLDLPTGNINAVGIYFGSSVGTVRIDNFQIDAAPVPEPSAFLILLGGGIVGAAFRTRSRRNPRDAR